MVGFRSFLHVYLHCPFISLTISLTYCLSFDTIIGDHIKQKEAYTKGIQCDAVVAVGQLIKFKKNLNWIIF